MSRVLKSLYVFIAVMVMGLPAHAAPEIGKAAPDFTLTDTNGVSHALSEYKGKTVVLEWSNHECPYVKKHYETGNMQKLQETATAEGVIWLTVVSSAPDSQGYTTPEQANAIMEKAASHPTARLLDPEGTVGALYEAKTTPHMFVINGEGNLVYMGAIDDNPSTDHDTVKSAKNYVALALAALKDGRLPETAQTKSYGCGIKYKTM